MSAPFAITPNSSGNDLLIKTPKGTLVALIYRVAGANPEADTLARAEAVCAALTASRVQA